MFVYYEDLSLSLFIGIYIQVYFVSESKLCQESSIQNLCVTYVKKLYADIKKTLETALDKWQVHLVCNLSCLMQFHLVLHVTGFSAGLLSLPCVMVCSRFT